MVGRSTHPTARGSEETGGIWIHLLGQSEAVTVLSARGGHMTISGP